MTMSAFVALPTLAQIDGWGAGHLDAAADAWTARAHTWEGSFATVFRAVSTAGDTPWEGAAADAATQRLGRDHRVVVDAGDLLKKAAAVARKGAAEIRAARRVALDQIARARGVGFDVEDDLSVAYLASSAEVDGQQAQAEAHARRIWKAADTLVSTDRRVAREITTAAEGLQELWFPTEQTREWPQALLADYAGVTAPLPEAPNLVYCHPSARPDFWWCEGFDIGSGPYAFGSPFDASGVA